MGTKNKSKKHAIAASIWMVVFKEDGQPHWVGFTRTRARAIHAELKKAKVNYTIVKAHATYEF